MLNSARIIIPSPVVIKTENAITENTGMVFLLPLFVYIKSKTTFQQGGTSPVVFCWLHEVNHLCISQIRLWVCFSCVHKCTYPLKIASERLGNKVGCETEVLEFSLFRGAITFCEGYVFETYSNGYFNNHFSYMVSLVFWSNPPCETKASQSIVLGTPILTRDVGLR